MRYVKSVLAGTVTLFLSMILLLVFLAWDASRRFGGAAEVGVDVPSLMKTSTFWMVVLVGFAVGFYWQFRRG
jgi:hypothetical protein